LSSSVVAINSTVPLTIDNAKTFIGNAIVTKTPMVILFHSGNIPYYRALAQFTKYEDILFITTYQDPTEAIMQHFTITQLPAIVTFYISEPDNDKLELKNNVQMAHFSGPFGFQEEQNFIYNLYLHSKSIFEKHIVRVPKLEIQVQFKNYCLSRDQICIIAMVNGDKNDKKSLENLKQQLKIIDDIQLHFISTPISFMWIDGICHDEVASHFEISKESVPTLVAYLADRKSFAQLVGNIVYENVVAWIDKITQDTSLLNLSNTKDVIMIPKSCYKIHRELKRPPPPIALNVSEEL